MKIFPMLNALTDLLFPRACIGCGGPALESASYLCWDCLARMAWIHPPFCRLCGDPVDGAVAGEFLCAACLDQVPAFDLARSAARYSGVLKTAVQEFKYHGATWLSRDLGMLLLACFNTHYSETPIDTLSYVPMYAAKERERSYNQACLLAQELRAARRHLHMEHLLIKTRPTPTQTHLTLRQRRANVKRSFTIKDKNGVAGRRILLIDDVMTTGATVNECARMLKQAGAGAVYVLTVARG